MQKIAPCMWFDTNALEAATFYTSMFANSSIDCVAKYPEGGGMPAGTVLSVRFSLCDQEFDALNGGPMFQITPAISFFVACETAAEIDALWAKLSDGGFVFMELDKYPFSERFGWVGDKYGVSWQLSLDGSKQKISPFLMFCREHHGQAEEAMRTYCQLFENSRITNMARYGEEDDQPCGTVKLASFLLDGRDFMAMDSAAPHQFTFTEGLSFYVYCNTQAEIDRVWDSLTANGGEESQCGWLKDRFGVSWQIVNEGFEKMLDDSNPVRAKRVMDTLFTMKKIDMQALNDAYNGV